jgi:predicted metal-binding membrane protein
MLAAGAWIFMVAHGVEHGHHGAKHVMSPAAESVHWLTMVIAMMFPLLAEPLRAVSFRTFPGRRTLASGTFLVGYSLVWAAAGVPVVWLRAQPWSHHSISAALAFGLSALWLSTRSRGDRLRRCNTKRPLAAWGWRAPRDVFAYGARVGATCVVTCWPMMAACTLTGHSVLALALGMVAAMYDRLAFRPAPRHAAAIAAFLALWYATPSAAAKMPARAATPTLPCGA